MSVFRFVMVPAKTENAIRSRVANFQGGVEQMPDNPTAHVTALYRYPVKGLSTRST